MQDSTELGSSPRFSRRRFLKAAAAGGALLLSVELTLPAAKAVAAPGDAGSETFNAVVRIGADGVVTLVMPRVEMGQGTYTSLPMLIA